MDFTRITVNASQMGGVPCVRGLRIPVATVVGMVAEGMTTDEILKAYPDLEPEDIAQTLRYAAEALARTRSTPPGNGMKFLVDNAVLLREYRENPISLSQIIDQIGSEAARRGLTPGKLESILNANA